MVDFFSQEVLGWIPGSASVHVGFACSHSASMSFLRFFGFFRQSKINMHFQLI